MRIARLQSGELVRVVGDHAERLDYDGDVGSLLRDGRRPEGLAVLEDVPLEELHLGPPLQPGKIIAIGLNYLDHCREARVEPPKEPLIFAKFPSSVVGPTDDVIVDRAVTDSVDWEAELGVVIARRMRGVSREQALDAVYGYTVVNDVSARDLQTGDGQWVRAKSLDTFCPVGPWIVTADEIQDPQNLRIRAAVNGVQMQDSSTGEMIFGVGELLAYCSRQFTLEPGDLLITGTPWGVGFVREPPILLQDGDIVTVEIDGIGELRNRIRDVARTSATASAA